MTPEEAQQQLEFFDLSNQPHPRLRQPSLGRLLLSLRYDQLVLAGIAGLIGIAGVFACGVERGKQLVRAERPFLVREEPEPSAASNPAARPARMQAPTPPPVTETKSKSPTAPTPARKKPDPSKLAAGTSRYAVQLVSYRTSRFAKQEMTRLHSSGERAFLVLRDGYTVLYAGPFASKVNAREKSAQLKTRYQGCFVKSL